MKNQRLIFFLSFLGFHLYPKVIFASGGVDRPSENGRVVQNSINSAAQVNAEVVVQRPGGGGFLSWVYSHPGIVFAAAVSTVLGLAYFRFKNVERTDESQARSNSVFSNTEQGNGPHISDNPTLSDSETSGDDFPVSALEESKPLTKKAEETNKVFDDVEIQDEVGPDEG